MSDEPDSRPGAWVRDELARLATLFGLAAVAIAQPLLSVFGDSPETFVFVRADRRDIVAFGVLVAVVPPLALWSVGLISRIAGSEARRGVHLVTVAGLGALIVLQVAPAADSLGVVLVVIAVLVGAALAWAIDRWTPLESWTRYLAILPVLTVGLFLYSSPVADLDGDQAPIVAAVADTGAPPPSLVVVVLDELPTGTLLDENGGIDAARYPNFAAVAGESTWYRGYSTLAAWSDVALPPMVTGRLPDARDAIFANHPENLFSLLAGSHELVVSESFSAFCGPSLCGDPGDPVGVGRSLSTSFDRGALFRLARETWIAQIDPNDDGGSVFDDFEEVIATVPASAADGESGARDSRVFFENQPTRFREFVEAIGSADDPAVYYLHLVLPHSPWQFHPDGGLYSLPAESGSLDGDRSNDWIATVNRQRHVFQTRYVDGLLGELRTELVDAGVWDTAVVAVVSDHGVSFAGGQFGRDVEGLGVDEVLMVPLFVKAPGETDAIVDDSNLSSIDLLPTLAEALGVEVPWALDGLPAGSPALAEREEKLAYRFQQGFERGETAVLSYPAHDLFDAMIASHPPPLGPSGLDVLYADLDEAAWMGSDLPDADADASTTAEVRSLERLERPAADEAPIGVVIGRVDDPPDEATVLVAFDGVVVGVAPLVGYRGEAGSIVVLLPPEAVDRSPRDVQMVLIRDDGEVVGLELRPA